MMRRFQQAQNRKNPITGCGEIDRRRSTLHKIIFLYMRRRSSTIDFSAASDRIFAILGLLESSHQGESKYDVSFVISALVKKFFELSQAGLSRLMRSTIHILL